MNWLITLVTSLTLCLGFSKVVVAQQSDVEENSDTYNYEMIEEAAPVPEERPSLPNPELEIEKPGETAMPPPTNPSPQSTAKATKHAPGAKSKAKK